MAELCPTCNAPFASPAELIEHTRAVHAGGEANAVPAREPGFVRLRCALCGATFFSPLELAAHNQRPHDLPGLPRRPVRWTARPAR